MGPGGHQGTERPRGEVDLQLGVGAPSPVQGLAAETQVRSREVERPPPELLLSSGKEPAGFVERLPGIGIAGVGDTKGGLVEQSVGTGRLTACGGGDSLQFEGRALASGSVGAAYSDTVSANAESIYYELDYDDNLPLGLYLAEDGAITGTPEEAAACPRSYTGQYLKKMLSV